MVLRILSSWWRRTFGAAPPLDPDLWTASCGAVRATQSLTPAELETLRGLVRDFLHTKDFVPVEDFPLTPMHRYTIAVAACIPILHLGLGAYRKFRSIYLFGDAFRPSGPQRWHPGSLDGALAGLAIQGGGVALAWSAAWEGVADDRDGQNTIIHEFAHKLDMLDGAADGRPPLPPGITQGEWFAGFTAAFADFQERVAKGRSTHLDAYAATNPAEFFAVLSEVYFETPETLAKEYPEVLRLLRAFYTQQPAG